MVQPSAKKVVYDLADRSIDKIAAAKIPSSRKKRAVEVAWRLQITLEVDKVITLFAYEVRKAVAYKSFAYKEPSTATKVSSGPRAGHSCTYHLTLGQESLGQLRFTRGKKFTNDEILELENLLAGLAHPLRNAIQYQRALQCALTDALTGLANRAAMTAALDREIKLARRNRGAMSLIVLDVDKFKRVNDKYGHAAGDAVLVSLAAGVKRCVRATDIVSRFGGEEFCVLLVGANASSALALAERVRKSVETFVLHYKDENISITVSLGLASLKDEDNDQKLFERADKALYHAKREGGNRISSVE